MNRESLVMTWLQYEFLNENYYENYYESYKNVEKYCKILRKLKKLQNIAKNNILATFNALSEKMRFLNFL